MEKVILNVSFEHVVGAPGKKIQQTHSLRCRTQEAKCSSWTRRNLLHVGTLIAHHLLSHLEAARSELRRPHLLPAVALPLPRGFFGDGLVAHNLHNIHTHTHT